MGYLTQCNAGGFPMAFAGFHCKAQWWAPNGGTAACAGRVSGSEAPLAPIMQHINQKGT